MMQTLLGRVSDDGGEWDLISEQVPGTPRIIHVYIRDVRNVRENTVMSVPKWYNLYNLGGSRPFKMILSGTERYDSLSELLGNHLDNTSLHGSGFRSYKRELRWLYDNRASVCRVLQILKVIANLGVIAEKQSAARAVLVEQPDGSLVAGT